MNRVTSLVLALVVVVSMAAVPLGAASAATYAQDEEDSEQASENASVAPGERLSGVVGVQAAEARAEVDDRTFGLQVANAQTQEEAADVVSERLADAEQRLAELEDRAASLNESRAAGELSEGEYRAEMAEVAAETAAVQRQLDRANATAQGLDSDVLADAGVDVEAIDTLRQRANELGGPEIAEIAQSIAGGDVGAPVGPAGDYGQPEDLPRGDQAEDRPGGGDAPNGTDGAPDDTQNTTDGDRTGGAAD